MTNDDTSRDDAIKLQKECRICGDHARGLNFSVVTCMSCKAFFRRHAYKQNLLALCQFENNCCITKRTRSYCSPCRLKKCLALGMDPTLIRHIPESTVNLKKKRTNHQTNNKQIQLPTPLPLSLLRNDRSTLTSGEWNLLSNFMQVYDEENAPLRIQCSLNKLSSLPPKLRPRSLELRYSIQELYASIKTLTQRVPDITSLPVTTRQAFIQHSLPVISVMHALFLVHELNIFDNISVLNAAIQMYGDEYMACIRRNIAQYDLNGILIKVFIFIMGFSSNCSIVRYNSEENISIILSSIQLVHIQNIYVTMLWKYLVYLYGYNAAALRFSRLVKIAMDTISTFNYGSSSEKRDRFLDTILADAERILYIRD